MMVWNYVGTNFYTENARLNYGPQIHDEVFMTAVSSVSSFIGVLTFIWAIMLEKFNFKVTFGLILIF